MCVRSVKRGKVSLAAAFFFASAAAAAAAAASAASSSAISAEAEAFTDFVYDIWNSEKEEAF